MPRQQIVPFQHGCRYLLDQCIMPSYVRSSNTSRAAFANNPKCKIKDMYTKDMYLL